METVARSIVVLVLASAACGPDKDPLDNATHATNVTHAVTTNGSNSNSSDPTGEPTSGGSGSGTTGGGTTGGPGSQDPTCAAYLACVEATTPETLPELEMAYGPEGTCWQVDQAIADQCVQACAVGLMNAEQLYPNEPKCCQSTDCDIDTTGAATTGATTTTTTGPVDCNDVPDQPMHAMCTDPSGCGCASGKCFVVPALGGFCSECLVDADCPGGGCSAANPIAGTGAQCNTGDPGDGCQTDAACNSQSAPTCGTVLEIPGIITVSTCGQCTSNADCGAQAPNCAPVYDIPNFTGQLQCRPNGSVPNGQGCALTANGGQVCASGKCGEASVMGLLKLGICGECETDADCGGGFCVPPEIDLNNGVAIPSQCQ